MKPALKYLLLTFIFAILASGVVIAAFIDNVGDIGLNFLWLIAPTAGLFLLAAILNDELLVSHLLLRRRYLPYFLAAFAVAYLGAYASVWLEYWMRIALELPQRVENYTSGWILIDTFAGGLLLLFILLGLGAWSLYDKWSAEADKERRYSDELNSYIQAVRKRFSTRRILSSITHIAETLRVNADDAIDEIQTLSSYLRTQLYELPAPPKPNTPAGCDSGVTDSRLLRWLSERRYRSARYMLFFGALPLISFTVFFNAPDQPVFTTDRFMSFIAMFLLLDSIALVNILWLFRRFRKRRNLKRYIAELGILIGIVIAPAIISEIATYDINVIDKSLPPLLVVISIIGSMLTLFLFVGGTGAIMLFQDWISGQRRMTMLRAETIRQEYAYLRKQINPHFLFNVLNNAGILLEEDPEGAVKMLAGLRRLLEFQFDQTNRPLTTVGREISFLNTYLNLEATRIEPFSFSITAEENLHNLEIPTLLFIPFVENAVKYSSVVNAHRRVSLFFSAQADKLCFRCVNTFNPTDKTDTHSGGLGINNTRRRLDLLYNSGYTFRQSRTSDSFIITLIIPCQHEMHHN